MVIAGNICSPVARDSSYDYDQSFYSSTVIALVRNYYGASYEYRSIQF